MENNPTTTVPPKKKSPLVPIILGIVALLAAFFGVRKINHAMHYEETDNAQIESNAVPVLSRIAGYVDTLNLADYQDVKAGQLLLSIDNREFVIAVQQAEADLLTAQADLATAEAALLNTNQNRSLASANQDVQQSRLQKAVSDLKRDEALFGEGSITQKQYEDSKSGYETALRQLGANKEQVAVAASQNGTSRAQIEKARAMIKVREAALESAKLKLTYTRIVAPASGRVGKVNLHPGQYLQPGAPLFSIVNNEQFWIIANFKETQLAKLKIGQPVEISMDGYPDQKITGKISSFSDATGAKFALLPADNATGNFVKITQRVPVKIDFDNASAYKSLLKAGLSVKVDVKVK